MSNELKVYRFSPDQPGKGGHTIGFHTFMHREDTRRVEGFRPFRMMWYRDRIASALSTNNYTGRTIYGYLEWFYFQAGGSTQKVQAVFADGYGSGGSNTIGMRTVGLNKDIYWETSTRAMGRVMFVPVKDRLIMGTRQGIARLWDGTVDGSDNPIHVYKLGCPSPTVAPTLSVVYNYTAGDYWYGMAGSVFVATPEITGTNASFDGLVENENVRLTHESLSSPNYFSRKVVKRVSGTTRNNAPTVGPFPLPTGMSITFNRGTNTASFDLAVPGDASGNNDQFAGLALVANVNSSGIKRYPIASCINGNITIMSGTMPTGWANTFPGTGTEVLTTFSLEGVQVTLDDVNPVASATGYQDANRKMSRPLAGAGYSSWTGAEGPGYAYAYYDPISGHISNLSPIAYVPELDVVNGGVTVDYSQWYVDATSKCANGDTPVSGLQSATGIQYIGEYNSTEVARFTNILWFRTRRSGGGAVLYPLGSLDPANAKWVGLHGSPSYATGTWSDTTVDADLLISGRIRAPLDTNHPPSYVSTLGVRTTMVPYGMAWWDGRLWVFGTPDPAALRYSCDAAQCPMGRSEESFPDLNRLVIPAGDGDITALLTCGEYLLVVTRRYAYRVLGNHESNYRLVRVSTEIGGLTAESLCEIPTDSEGGGMLAAVTADKRVLIVQLDSSTEEIGAPIVTELGGPVGGMAFYRMDGHARLAIAVSATDSLINGAILEYNFTHKTWSKNLPALHAGTNALDGVNFLSVMLRNGVAMGGFINIRESMLVFGIEGDLYFYSPLVTEGAVGSMISTWALPGQPTKRRYQFVWARMVCIGTNTGTITPPYLYVNRDGRSSDVRYQFHEHSEAERRYFNGGTGLDGTEIEFVSYGPAWDRWGGAAITNDGTLPTGYSLSFEVWPNGNDVIAYGIPFIEIAIREITEDGEVEP